MRVILGSDHGGFSLKEKIKTWLLAEGHEIADVGSLSLMPDDDYVDYAKAAVKESKGDGDRIVLFCRNGFGMAIAANRFAGTRCGIAFGEEAVRRGRTDDNINCLSIPADYIEEEAAERMIKVFLTTEFSNTENYKRRVMKLETLTQ